MGDRARELAVAVSSLQRQTVSADVVVVANGTADRFEAFEAPHDVVVVEPGSNLGVPGGRDLGVSVVDRSVDVVGFLDDDAQLTDSNAAAAIMEAFNDERCGAVTLRIVDENGATARRHVPRRGAGDADRSGDVATFLGGACAIRRSAYEQVGGYFTDLRYGHEELELSWRLLDAGWSIRYIAHVTVLHPATDIARHADGWRLTGRNRVWIARRTLPWPVAIAHVTVWLGLGLVRAPRGCRRAYLRGWADGWRGRVGRAPIRWSTVHRLGRLGRLPVY